MLCAAVMARVWWYVVRVRFPADDAIMFYSGTTVLLWEKLKFDAFTERKLKLLNVNGHAAKAVV